MFDSTYREVKQEILKELRMRGSLFKKPGNELKIYTVVLYARVRKIIFASLLTNNFEEKSSGADIKYAG